MTIGAKYLILLAISIFLESVVIAQWHESAWNFTSSTAHQRTYLTTNLYAAKQTFVLHNVIPTMTNGVFSNVVSTQEFLCAIGPETNDIDTNNPPVFKWELQRVDGTGSNLETYGYNATGTCARTTNTMILDSAAVRDLDVYFAIDERVERPPPWFVNNFPARFYRSHYQNVVYAKSAILNLLGFYLDTSLATNGTLGDIGASMTNATWETNFPCYQWSGTNNLLTTIIGAPSNYWMLTYDRSIDMTNGAGMGPVVTGRWWFALANGVTNTLTLHGPWGDSCNATVIGTTNTVTNSIVHLDPTNPPTVTLWVTNGQAVTFVSSNNPYTYGGLMDTNLTNCTTGSYGQWALRAALTNMAATQHGVYFTNEITGAGGNGSNWASAVADAASNYNGGAVVTNFGWISGGDQATYSVGAHPTQSTFTGVSYWNHASKPTFHPGQEWTWMYWYDSGLKLSSNLTFTGQVYFRVYRPWYYTETNFVFDNNGHFAATSPSIILIEAYTVTGCSNNVYDTTNWFGGSATNLTSDLPVLVDEPPVDNNSYTRGYYFGGIGVAWWDFKYK